ncbi:MAG TPA: DUF3568 family protein [Oligoflexia bacterium]|nr:DUF3568 family protein [Oligoflexia bacterium]HMP27667.1 DUF3568 family protein [Oligoflexia bacterium]
MRKLSKMQLVYITFIVLSSLSLFSNCSSLRSGTEKTVGYVRGQFEEQLNASFQDVVNASQTACENLQFSDLTAKSDALSARITARDANNKQIEISLKKIADSQTWVAVKVGLIGDDRISQAIISEIKKQL